MGAYVLRGGVVRADDCGGGGGGGSVCGGGGFFEGGGGGAVRAEEQGDRGGVVSADRGAALRDEGASAAGEDRAADFRADEGRGAYAQGRHSHFGGVGHEEVAERLWHGGA